MVGTKGKSQKKTEAKGRGKTSTGKGKGKTAEERKAEREAKREADALKQFAKRQERREREKQAAIRAARKTAEKQLRKLNKAKDGDARVAVFVNLWKNAEGTTIRIMLNTLVESAAPSSPNYIKIVARSMLKVDFQGFSFQLADGLWRALTFVEDDDEGVRILDAVMINFRNKNKSKNRSGCSYVRNLFTDAEVLAIENGSEIDFARAIDDDRHLPLTQCFYKRCTSAALSCCKDEDIILSGRCKCSKKEPNQCTFNLFFNTPRPIWRCSGEDCDAPKCLCPVVKQKKPKNGKGGKGGKGAKKPKDRGNKPKRSL